MTKATRKFRRKKEKEKKKQVNKVMKDIGETISKMPKVCSSCKTELDVTDKESLDKWRIQVFRTGRAQLTCPDCLKKNEDAEVSDT